MQPKVWASIINFLDLSDKEKLEFSEWLTQEYKDFLRYSELSKSERFSWKHMFRRPAKAEELSNEKI